MLMLFGIALVVASKFFLIGVLIALWSLWTGIGPPLWKMVAHVFTSPQLHRNRAYAVRMTLGVAGGLALLLFAIPAPHHLNAQGVVWLPDQAHIRAGTSGFVTRVAVPEVRSWRRANCSSKRRSPRSKPMSPSSTGGGASFRPRRIRNWAATWSSAASASWKSTKPTTG